MDMVWIFFVSSWQGAALAATSKAIHDLPQDHLEWPGESLCSAWGLGLSILVELSQIFPVKTQDSWPDHGSISLQKLGCHMALRIKILSGNIRGTMGVQRWHLNSGGHDAKSSDRSKGPVARKSSRSDDREMGEIHWFSGFPAKSWLQRFPGNIKEYIKESHGLCPPSRFLDGLGSFVDVTCRLWLSERAMSGVDHRPRCSMKSWLHMNLYVNLYVLWILSDSMVGFRCFHLFQVFLLIW